MGISVALGFPAEPRAQTPGAAPAPRTANHEAWRTAIDGATASLAARDLARARAQIRIALHQATPFDRDDPRLRTTVEAMTALNRASTPAAERELLALYEGCIREFDADGRGSSAIALDLRNLVGFAYLARRDSRRAALAFREQRARSDPEGPTRIYWLQGTLGLAQTEFDAGNASAALELARDAAERTSRQFGPEHVGVYQARSLEARALRATGRVEEAASAYAAALQIGERLPKEQARDVAMLRVDHGTYLMELCRFDAARRELKSGVDALVVTSGAASHETAQALHRLATVETLRGDWLAAQPVAQRAVRSAEDNLRGAGARDPRALPQLVDSQVLLADIYLAVQRTGDAKASVARAQQVSSERPEGARDLDLLSRQAQVEAALGANESAQVLADQALAHASRASVPPLVAADVRVRVADIALGRNDFALADSLTAQALPAIERSIAPEERLLRALHASARAQAGLGRPEDALATVQRARARVVECFGALSPRLTPLTATEAELLAALGRDAELEASRARLEELDRARGQLSGAESPGRKRLEDREMNIAFTEPGSEWVEVPIEGESTARLRGFRRADPAMMLVLQGGDSGAPADVTDDQIRALAFEYTAAELGGAQMHEIIRSPRSIAGIEGSQATEEWLFGERKELRVRWIGVRGGWKYSLMLLSDQASAETLVLEARRAFQGFSPLDPSRVAERAPILRTFRSRRFGYSFDGTRHDLVLADRADWPKRVEVFAYQRRRDAVSVSLFVVPVALGSAASEPEVVDAALLQLVDPRVRNWGSAKIVDAGGARGRERDGTLEADGEAARWRARTFQRGGVGWAIAVGTTGLPEAAAEKHLAAVSAVVLESARPPAPATWTEAERLRQGLFENALGLVYREARQPLRAIECFERAAALGPVDPVTIENLARSRMEAGRFREAARGLDGALRDNPKNVAFLALRGVALRRAGEPAPAERDLRKAVENGHPSQELYGEWLGCLFDLGRGDEALALVDARVRERGAPEDRVTRAFVLIRLGRHEQAVAEFGELAREYPSDAGIQQMLLGVALMSGDPATLLAAVDRLIEAAGSAPLLLALRGVALDELGREAEAISALDQALKLAPEATEIRDLRDRLLRERGPRT